MCGKTGLLRCKPNRIARTGCKYCRYKRCRDNAGMVDKWVLSAFTRPVPKEENYDDNKSKREERLKNKLLRKKTLPSMEVEIDVEIDPRINADFVETMSAKYRKSFLHNPAVIYMVLETDYQFTNYLKITEYI